MIASTACRTALAGAVVAAAGVVAPAFASVVDAASAAAPALAGGGRAFAVLESRFGRSVATWCEEFEAEVGERHHLWEYVADFRADLPISGLALEGELLNRSATSADFLVHSAVGPWRQRTGVTPRLRCLRLSKSVAVPERIFSCKGLALYPETEVKVSLSLDTSKAYNWMRFTGYLDWARYFIDTIREDVRDRPSSPPLVADIGGGSGWLSVLMKAHLGDDCDVLCTDVSADALELAASDAGANGLELILRQGDLYEPVLQFGSGRRPRYVYFNPPQVKGAAGEWRGSPDVSLLSPDDDAAHFHGRFCREAELEPGGVAWLGVNWEVLPEAVHACCAAGWRVILPARLRDLSSAPSALLELRRPLSAPEEGASEKASVAEEEECILQAMAQAEEAAEYQVRAIGAEDDAERVQVYRRAAERGVAAGQANFGIAQAMGRGIAADGAAAAAWLRRAAAQGHEDAQVQLGRILAGTGAEEDAASAVMLFREAAEHGHARAQASLGFMCLSGAGASQDAEEGLRWLARAAAQGDARALATLGESYANGLGVPRNDTAAMLWYERAAAQGDVVAQTNLGLMYAEGRGVPRPDSAAAAAWFLRAAENGGLSAQLNLGAMCETGEGMLEDPAAAAFWYTKAAEQGSAEAQGRLAALYFEGRGLECDLIQGVHWLSSALSQRDAGAAELLDNLRAAADDGDPEAAEILAELQRFESDGGGGGDGASAGAGRSGGVAPVAAISLGRARAAVRQTDHRVAARLGSQLAGLWGSAGWLGVAALRPGGGQATKRRFRLAASPAVGPTAVLQTRLFGRAHR